MSADPIPSRRFQTSTLPPGEGFELWRSVMGEIYDVPPPPGDATTFSAAMTVWNVGGALLTAGTFTEQRFIRSAQRARKDAFDPYTILLHRAGHWRADTGEHTIESGTGRINLLDFARPVISEATANDSITLTLPRELLDAVLPGKNLHGMSLEGARGQLLAEFLTLLTTRLPSLSVGEAPHLAAACRDMVAACLAPSLHNKHQAAPQIDALIYRRVRQAIDANLHRVGWGADELGRALGLSRSSLYRVMAPYGGVAAHILSRRLARAHGVLSRSGGGVRVSEVADGCGFSSVAHFSRAFRHAFGYAPRDAIGHGHLLAPAQRNGMAAPGEDGLFREWIRDLRR